MRQTIITTTDLAGLVSGLPFADGAKVYAVADGYVLGPYIVASGAINLRDAYVDVEVGFWEPPVYESMPSVLVGQNDEIVRRPGRIASVYLDIIDTTSIAVGANNSAPEDIDLVRDR
ncbi:MAG: hypothetical protein U5K75_00115 [Ahrensia sp.]|nr:hypothetical protein [Ahrensia sp.]